MSSVQERTQALLKQAGESRAGLKRAADALDRLPDAERGEARAALMALAGVQPADDALEHDEAGELTSKRLLRWALGREAEAQRPGNPTHRDEAFACARCGVPVPPGGARVRDHCPACLYGLHVDGEVPGDRAAGCGGLLTPTGLERRGEDLVLTHTCALCGVVRRVRAHPDDDPAALRALSAASGWRAIR
ncbi:MAG: hypothetical protein RIT28_3418 [Pseudomonadota bacterium]